MNASTLHDHRLKEMIHGAPKTGSHVHCKVKLCHEFTSAPCPSAFVQGPIAQSMLTSLEMQPLLTSYDKMKSVGHQRGGEHYNGN